MAEVAQRLYTGQEFERLPDAESFELDDGVLQEFHVEFEPATAAVNLVSELRQFLRNRPLGRVVPPNVGLQIFRDRPGRVPRSDGGDTSALRLPFDETPEGFLTAPPEIVIESISLGDRMAYMDRKFQEYLDAGVRRVWAPFPDTRTAEVRRDDGTGTRIPRGGAIDGEGIIPGFRCELATIMPGATETTDQ
jgi:Uma2 family endonuclease